MFRVSFQFHPFTMLCLDRDGKNTWLRLRRTWWFVLKYLLLVTKNTSRNCPDVSFKTPSFVAINMFRLPVKNTYFCVEIVLRCPGKEASCAFMPMKAKNAALNRDHQLGSLFSCNKHINIQMSMRKYSLCQVSMDTVCGFSCKLLKCYPGDSFQCQVNVRNVLCHQDSRGWSSWKADI